MAQKTRFIKFIEDPDVKEYTVRVESIQNIAVTGTNGITVTVKIAPGSLGDSGQGDSTDKVVITCPAHKGTAVAVKIIDQLTSDCCGGSGSPYAVVDETWDDITTIVTTVDAP